MERTWFIVVDQNGEEIHTSSVREAETAFCCGGIVTMVREQDMDADDDIFGSNHSVYRRQKQQTTENLAFPGNMTSVQTHQTDQKEVSFSKESSRKQTLKDRADRFSLRRAFETVREMHGLPQKIRKPK
ncbi:MAG: hypothetical protein FWC43_01665 [Planctomycetaceae bacterium]|nr:hypothetical protein [Planctomycetaceae bacterium]